MRVSKVGNVWVDLDAVVGITEIYIDWSRADDCKLCYKLVMVGGTEFVVGQPIHKKECVVARDLRNTLRLAYPCDDGKVYETLNQIPDGVKLRQQVEFEKEQTELINEWARGFME